MFKGVKRWFVQRLSSHHTSNNVEPCLENAGVMLERHDLSTLDPEAAAAGLLPTTGTTATRAHGVTA